MKKHSGVQRQVDWLSYLIILIFAIVIMWPQIHSHTFITGFDTDFHMNRFYDAAMQIKTGRLSYFSSWFGYSGIGRIVNPLYGPVFAYLMGALLLLTGSWLRWEITVSVLVLLIAGISTYRLGRDNQVNRLPSLLMAGLYMVSPVIILWPTQQSFTGLGAAFLPLVLMAGCRILRTRQLHPVKLALLMALLLQIHVLTTLISGIVIVAFFGLAWLKAGHRIRLMIQALKALGLFILLTANVWGAMLTIMPRNNIVRPYPNSMIGTTGIRIDWLHFWWGFCNLGPQVTLLMIAAVVAFVINRQYNSKFMKSIAGFSLIAFVLSSQYVPWKMIAERVQPVYFYLQSAIRILPVALISLTLLWGLLMMSFCHDRVAYGIMIAVSLLGILTLVFGTTGIEHQKFDQFQTPTVFSRINYVYHVHDERKYHASFSNHDLSLPIHEALKAAPDYLPSRVDVNTLAKGTRINQYAILSNEILKPNRHFQRKYVPSVHGMQLTWRSRSDRKQLLPLVKYHRTVMIMNGRVIHPKITDIGAIIVRPHRGRNQIVSYYQPARWFYVLCAVSLIGWIVIIYCEWHRFRN